MWKKWEAVLSSGRGADESAFKVVTREDMIKAAKARKHGL